MGTFAIACPRCGKYVTATKFWIFGSRKVTCSCGHEIDVRAERLASRTCAHCGNVVVYDQTKGGSAACPVCGEGINTPDLQRLTETVPCERCGLLMNVSKTASAAECPLCGHKNNVVAALSKEKIKRDAMPVVLKFEGEPSTLVWKHPVEDFVYGSQLIVHESQEAVFFRDGKALDSFGAGRYTLDAQRIPLLSGVVAPNITQGELFHAEVYYVNLATILGLKWGTDSKVRLFDPASGIHIEIGASGEFNIRVKEARRLLLKAIGTGRTLQSNSLLGNGETGEGFFRALVMAQVKSGLARCIRERAINILEIDERLTELSTALKSDINGELEKYGLEVTEFVVSRILTPDNDPAFQRLRRQYADLYLSVREEQIKKKEMEAQAERRYVEASMEARLRTIEAGGVAEALRIQKQAEADALRMVAQAEAEKMRLQGYTYQQETHREVGLEAMKNGLVGTGGGTSPIGEMASLGVALSTMGAVAHMAKEAIEPVMPHAPTSPTLSDSPNPENAEGTWTCCGSRLSSPFCPQCGASKPCVATWQCECGAQGLTSKFCPNCGSSRPVTGE